MCPNKKPAGREPAGRRESSGLLVFALAPAGVAEDRAQEQEGHEDKEDPEQARAAVVESDPSEEARIDHFSVPAGSPAGVVVEPATVS